MPKKTEEPREITVVSTMAGPLWSRATFSKLYPEILEDPKAAEIVEKMNVDFSTVAEFVGEFLGLNFLVRARSYDDAIKNFIEKHPNATIVNMGCGLDTTFSRVDNGTIKWYNLDLPKAIEYRLQFIPETPRSKCIAKSVFEYSWCEDLNYAPDDGIFLFAAGLFNYFKEVEIISLCKTIAQRFPGGELMFDTGSKWGIKIMNRRLKKMNLSGVKMYFGLANPVKHIAKWSEKFKVVDWFTLFERTPRNPRWKKSTRRLMNLSDRFKMGKYAQIRFLE